MFCNIILYFFIILAEYIYMLPNLLKSFFTFKKTYCSYLVIFICNNQFHQGISSTHSQIIYYIT